MSPAMRRFRVGNLGQHIYGGDEEWKCYRNILGYQRVQGRRHG